MTLKVYGLNKCSTCQKARTWLDENDLEHSFSDVKEVPLDSAQVSRWSSALGGWEKMINRAGYTWRGLSPSGHGQSYGKESGGSRPAQSFAYPPPAD